MQHVIKPLTHAGDSYTLDAGDRLVHVTRQELVYRVTVTTASFGNRPVGDDDRSFTTQAEADHYSDQLAQVLTAGPVDVDTLIAQINAEVDEATAKTQADRDQFNADVNRIMAGGEGGNNFRKVRLTRTHVFVKPLSDPQTTAIRNHRDGVIRLGNGVTRPMLAALADKNFGTLNYQPNMGARKVIASLTLNTAGLEIAEQVAA